MNSQKHTLTRLTLSITGSCLGTGQICSLFLLTFTSNWLYCPPHPHAQPSNFPFPFSLQLKGHQINHTFLKCQARWPEILASGPPAGIACSLPAAGAAPGTACRTCGGRHVKRLSERKGGVPAPCCREFRSDQSQPGLSLQRKVNCGSFFLGNIYA